MRVYPAPRPHAAIARRALILCIAGAAALAGAARAEEAASNPDDVVTFQLAVPAQARFVETRTIEKAFGPEDNESPAEVQKLSQVSDVTIRRRPAGFSVTVKPRQPQEVETASSAGAALANALRGLQLRYEFDSNGDVVGFYGLDKLIEELSSALPPAMLPIVEAMLPRMAEQMKDEWRSRYLGLVGRTFRVGYTGRAQRSVALLPQTAPVPATVAVGVQRRAPCGDGRECVVFFLGYVVEDPGSFGDALSAMLRDWIRLMVEQMGGAEAKPKVRELLAAMPKVKVTEMVNYVERLVDPQTMIVYREVQLRTFKLKVDAEVLRWAERTSLAYDRQQ